MLRSGQLHYALPEPELVRDRASEALASVCTAQVDVAAATLRGHTGAEADFANAADLGRAIGWLHDVLPLNVLNVEKRPIQSVKSTLSSLLGWLLIFAIVLAVMKQLMIYTDVDVHINEGNITNTSPFLDFCNLAFRSRKTNRHTWD